MTKKIFVIAGEASGDLHGSNLIKNLKKTAKPPIEIYGVGGDKIRETGALEFFDLAHFHVTGITEAIKRLPKYQEAGRIIFSRIQKVRPDLVVLIDNPGFNLHLAQKIHGLGIPIVYYIAPQVWAWAPKRILKIKRFVKKVIVVFSFEKEIYENEKIPVVWVGHPLKDLIDTNKISEPVWAAPSNDGAPLHICLLPGSRKGEIKMLFSVMLKAAGIISKKFPGAAFHLIKSPTLSKEFYERLIPKNNVKISLVEENSYETIRRSDLAIVCSGTATLECALLGTPMIITNKGSFLTYIAAKSLIRVLYLGLPNLVLQGKKIPEFLQYDATPEKISEEALRILSDNSLRCSMKKALKEVSEKLGPPGATERAAQEILAVIASPAKQGEAISP